MIGNQDVLGTTVNCYTKTNVISEKDSLLNGNIGGLIGIASGSVIYCYASGNVKGKRCCGGLLGSLEGMATAHNCYATGDVISSDDLAGGLIGYLYDGSLANSCSTGKVQGNIYVGGLVGKQGGLSGISNCYSSSNVTAASDYAGGLVGAQISPPYFQNFNSISNCYAGGSIETKGEHFGAISGYLDEESSISKCYRYNDFTINGNKILEDDKNSAPDKINGGIITEPKPAQAPNVNITISETENTDQSVAVQLEIMSNNEIKNVSYVKVVQKINLSNIISNGHITSADYNTDINLLLSDFYQYSELTGESENAAVIYDYYINAGYPNDNGNTITIKNNSFKVNQNGEYIICAEDINNNKTFIYININNINSTPINTEQPTASPNYLYDIKDLSILSISGDKLETPPENASFIVETSVNKKKDNNTKDYIFVAIYAKNGILLNLDYVKANFAPNYDCSFGFNIPASLGEIGEIKTFI